MKKKRILIIVIVIILIAVMVLAYFYKDKIFELIDINNSSVSTSYSSSNSTSVSTSYSSSNSTSVGTSYSSSNSNSSNSSSTSSATQGGELYQEYDNNFEYLTKFDTQIQEYNNLTDKTGVCKVHFVDVGQGDCMIIELPDGKVMAIDAGDNKAYVKTAIKDYLEKLEITKIDYLLATHQDADHIGSMDTFFQQTQIEYVYRPYVKYTGSLDTSGWDTSFNNINTQGGLTSTTKAYYTFLDLILEESGCDWEFFNKDTQIDGSVLVGGATKNYSFDFLTPLATVTQIAYKNSNDYSPFVLFSYCGVDILFTGDAEKVALKEYMDTYSNTYDVDVLKVGHHGSLTSTTDEYIKAIKPEYSVIQVGEGNKHEHPRQEIVDILHNNQSTILRNDTNGDVVLTICPNGSFFFEVEKSVEYQRVLNGIVVA